MTAIGIDFGDKISSAAILRDGRAELVPSGETGIFGDKSFPSCVALTSDDRILVGEPARRQAADNPTGTATGFKWFLGRQQFLMLRKRAFSSERLTTFLFEKIKGDAEIFAKTRIEVAVVGVPPDFEQVQRQALVEAAQIAGFSDMSLIDEPCAAAVACGFDHRVPKSESVRSLVVDFGGSGLAISVLEHRAGEPRVISSTRWAELSGGAMDEAVFRSLEQKFKADTGRVVSQDPKASVRLRQAAEIARIELNEGRTATIALPVLVGLGEEFAACGGDIDARRARPADRTSPVPMPRRGWRCPAPGGIGFWRYRAFGLGRRVDANDASAGRL